LATFLVTTAADVVDATDGALSLREAIAQANADAAPDEIVFAGSVQGRTIELTAGELLVTSSVSIDGGVNGVSLDGLEASRVIHVAGSGAQVAIQSLVIGNGKVAGFGGGILADSGTASLTIVDSQIGGNFTTGESGFGGGLASFAATTTVLNSTIAGNTTAGDAAFGAGIWAVNRLILTDATVTGNATLGGGFAGTGVAGGGVFVGGTALVEDCIVLGNNGAGQPNDVGGQAITSNGHNLLGSDVLGSVAGDLQNIGATAVFAVAGTVPGGTPVLGGVAVDNSGPTGTAALLDSAANPALGRSSIGGPTTDQRGDPRPAPPGTAPDIGAFELQEAPPVRLGTARGERLVGTADDEHLRGLGGDDHLFGRGAGDRLEGGRSNDRLHGDWDGDLLHGGQGADRFVFKRPAHSTADDQDLILEFSRREGDRLDLRALDGDALRSGDQPLKFVGRSEFEGSGEVRFTEEFGHTVVEVNLDHDSEAELGFRLDRDVALHRSDFLL
jgi:Ca2+-binding RTX toxin-like protein